MHIYAPIIRDKNICSIENLEAAKRETSNGAGERETEWKNETGNCE